MFGIKRYLFSGAVLLPLSMAAGSAFCGVLSTSIEVQANLDTLQQTKNCPKCDLSGADLTRMDLSGANLAGANLSRAKLNLANLCGANLRETDLRDVGFGGADLAGADLRGADLRGTSFAGAYMKDVLLDGELISTKPYAQERISNVEERRYVEDTVKPKTAFKAEELSIGPRRDFEEIPPMLPVDQTELVKDKRPAGSEKKGETISDQSIVPAAAFVPQQSAEAPEAKVLPTMQEARMSLPEKNEMAPVDKAKKVAQTEIPVEENISAVPPQHQDVKATATTKRTATEGVTVLASVSKNGEMTDAVEDKMEPIDPEGEAAVEEARAGEPTIEKKKGGTDSLAAEELNKLLEKTLPDQPEERGEILDHSGDSTLEQIRPTSDPEVLRNVELLLETNRCYECNLERADLSGEDLEEADLEGANLQGANLQAADLEGANLKGAMLSAADLRKADLDEADLYKADLSNADLTDASLDNTMIDDAVFTGVKGYHQGTLLLMEETE